MIAAAAAGDEENVRSILNHYSNIVASAVYADSDPESIDIVCRVDIHAEEGIALLCDHRNKVFISTVNACDIRIYFTAQTIRMYCLT